MSMAPFALHEGVPEMAGLEVSGLIFMGVGHDYRNDKPHWINTGGRSGAWACGCSSSHCDDSELVADGLFNGFHVE